MVRHFKIGSKLRELRLNEIPHGKSKKLLWFLAIFAGMTISATEISLGQGRAKTTQKTNKLGRFLNENKIFSDHCAA